MRAHILICVIITLLFNQSSYAQITLDYNYIKLSPTANMYGEKEILHGKIRWIIDQTYSELSTTLKSKISPKRLIWLTDTTVLDKRGNIIKGHLGPDFVMPFYNSAYFDKYVNDFKNLKVQKDTIDKIRTDIISVSEMSPIGIKYIAKNRQQLYRYDYSYNTQGLIFSIKIYGPNDHLELKETYKYNDKNMLDKITDYNEAGKLIGSVYFAKYVFDKKGNWISRIAGKVDKYNLTTDMIVNRRLITYY